MSLWDDFAKWELFKGSRVYVSSKAAIAYLENSIIINSANIVLTRISLLANMATKLV
jgi:hypothetical protein